jgi:hypothetical protein
MDAEPRIPHRTTEGGNGIYQVCHELSAKLGVTI